MPKKNPSDLRDEEDYEEAYELFVYIQQVVPEEESGGWSDARILSEAKKYTVAGYDFEMFTPEGNAACAKIAAAAYAVDPPSREQSIAILKEGCIRLALSEFSEVLDSEPRNHFTLFINMMAYAYDWEPINSLEFLGPAYEASEKKRKRLIHAREEAAQVLIARHWDEFDTLVQQFSKAK